MDRVSQNTTVQLYKFSQQRDLNLCLMSSVEDDPAK